MKFTDAKCPRCGEPPRYIIGIFRVRTEAVNQRDKTGKLTGEVMLGERRWIGKPVDETVVLECGGGHQWESKHEHRGQN